MTKKQKWDKVMDAWVKEVKKENMEKTALHQLRDKLKIVVDEIEDLSAPGTYEFGYLAAMKSVINDIESQMFEIDNQQRKSLKK